MGNKKVCLPIKKLTKEAWGTQYCDGRGVCNWVVNCKFNHVSINQLCSKDKKAWVRHVLITSGLDFHTRVDKIICKMTLGDVAEE